MADIVSALGQPPPFGSAKPPDFPGRPDLFDEVEWGSFPSPEDIRQAYKLWSLPDSVLGSSINTPAEDHPYPNPETPTETAHRGYSCLAHNVYEHLMQAPGFPIADDEWDETAQMRIVGEGGTRMLEGWSYRDAFGVDPPVPTEPELDPQEITLEGHRVLGRGYWTIARTSEELRKRGIDVPNKPKLHMVQELLVQDEIHKREMEARGAMLGFLPREDQSQWGIPRRDDYMVGVGGGTILRPLDMYTLAILLSPYNPTYWVSRAYLYYQMGYFDLALGDAHRAHLLCETVANQKERGKQPGLYVRVWNAVEQHVLQIPAEDGEMSREAKIMRQLNGIIYFIPTIRKALHHIMSLSLLALQCWEDYKAMEEHLPSRLQMSARDKDAFTERNLCLERFIERSIDSRRRSHTHFLYEKRAGTVSGRTYPYSAMDVDRAKKPFRVRINEDILRASQAKSGKLEVKSGIIGLGVFAKDDIIPGEIIYVDEPSARGHLSLSHERTLDSRRIYCENCKRTLSMQERLYWKRLSQQDKDAVKKHKRRFLCPCIYTENPHDEVHWCQPTEEELRGLQNRSLHETKPDTEETGNKRAKRRKISKNDSDAGNDKNRRKSCLEIARELYHYQSCGIDWTWLHDAMRPNWDHRILAHRETHNVKGRYSRYSHTNERQCTVLSLLLREIFDITLLRREKENKPDLLAHEIEEMMPLMGAEDLSEHRFPFTLAANIRVPFDILLCLGVDIFRDLTFDTWVIQTALRKLLLNAVPWDEHRRDAQDGVDFQKPDPASSEVHQWTQMQYKAERFDPTIRHVYLFPGLSMFNHACRDHHNAVWEWDRKIPNRVKVRAISKIERKDEILLPYRWKQFSEDSANRVLGEPCSCSLCESELSAPRETTLSESSSSSYKSSDSESDGELHRRLPGPAGRDSFSHSDTPEVSDPPAGRQGQGPGYQEPPTGRTGPRIKEAVPPGQGRRVANIKRVGGKRKPSSSG